MAAEAGKAAAAARALELVQPGMLLGLGSGTTARLFIVGLGRLVASGLRVAAVPSSRATAELAVSLRIPLVTDIDRAIDLAVDGADVIDPELRLIKGAGGALSREKLVAAAARRFVVIADESKLAPGLGRGPLPVEILPFLWRQTAGRLEAFGAQWSLRGGQEQPFLTDNGNLVLDLVFGAGISDAESLGAGLHGTPGVVEHGLFLGLATAALIGGPSGVRVLGDLGWAPDRRG